VLSFVELPADYNQGEDLQDILHTVTTFVGKDLRLTSTDHCDERNGLRKELNTLERCCAIL
jgi:hypothetical protein